MLSTLAAIQLLALAQVTAPPRLVTPEEASAQDAAGATATAQGAAPAPAPPPASAPAPAAAPAKAERPRMPSLQSAESLRGTSFAAAWAGWSSLGAAYAIGVTEYDDIGGYLDFDWATTESRLGALYRRPLAVAGKWDIAGRLAVAWYKNWGGTGVYDENHSDGGITFAPALVFSQRAGAGVIAIAGEAPMTITLKYKSGFLFEPRLSASYEMFLVPQITVGARAAIGYRAGAGDAPLSSGRGELQFLVLAGYQIL